MKDIESLFNAVESDYGAFRNLAMYILTIFVNKGIIELQWDIHSQEFCFTINNYNLEKESSFEIDPDEILSKMMKRRNKGGSE